MSQSFNILLLKLDWSTPPASFIATFGTQTMLGGAGLIGEGGIQDLVALSGSFEVSAPVPTAKVLQGGVVGTAYSETISAQRGTAPYTFALTVGSLPTGLTLDGTTGVISGTPTTVETADFTIQATDANAAVGSTDFEIGVSTAFVPGAISGYTSGPLRRNPLFQ